MNCGYCGEQEASLYHVCGPMMAAMEPAKNAEPTWKEQVLATVEKTLSGMKPMPYTVIP